VFVDGTEFGKTYACDQTQRAPCPQTSFEAPFNTAGWGADGPHQLTLKAVDGGGNSATASRTVYIDNTAPDAPQNLTVDSGDGWRSSNSFNLRWRVGSQGSGSPVAGAEYDLCPLTGACVHGRKDGTNLAAISDLRLPGPGEYTLKLWLRDQAGNNDARLAGALLKLRYDDVSPQAAFEPLSADDPTRLVVDTTDKGSGVASGQIEIRRQGREQWLALPTSLDGQRLVARIDDARLGDGVFELRARAVDQAGNERSTDRRTDGSPAQVTLPLRLKTKLRGGLVQRRGGHTRLARSAYVRYGQLVRVRGRLVTPEGNPMQDVEVHAFTQVRDGSAPPRLIATVRASRTGRFTFLVRRGPSRVIRIVYNGTAQIRSATRMVTLNVRARTTMGSSRRYAANGQTVRFHGRIRTGPIPDQGKLVELQVWVRGRWRTFATTRAGRTGRWRYVYRFDGTRGHTTYRFRAKIPPEAGYPFATGQSRVVRIAVRGL
jgi:hypothetical protein